MCAQATARMAPTTWLSCPSPPPGRSSGKGRGHSCRRATKTPWVQLLRHKGAPREAGPTPQLAGDTSGSQCLRTAPGQLPTSGPAGTPRNPGTGAETQGPGPQGPMSERGAQGRISPTEAEAEAGWRAHAQGTKSARSRCGATLSPSPCCHLHALCRHGLLLHGALRGGPGRCGHCLTSRASVHKCLCTIAVT